MSDLDRVHRAKSKRDGSAFKKGIREGWDQAMWFVFGLLMIVIFIDQWT